MNYRTYELIINMSLNDPASKEDIERTEKALNISFPSDYRAFMQENDGGEGAIGENSYLMLWTMQDIIKLNEAYGVNEFTPGLILIGSDGGDIAYAFDMRFDTKPVVKVPFIGMNLNKIKDCEKNFEDFLIYLYKL